MALQLQKIIVCLDHTENDHGIIKNACEISKIAGTKEVIFLNIIKDFALPDELIKEFPDLLNQAISDRRSELNELIQKFTNNSTINTELIVRQGSISKEILGVATETKSDLIVMGRNAESESVLSTRIARRSPCNLLLIPQGSKLNFENVFIPVDFSDYSELSLHTALSLTDSSSTIYLHNVITVPSSYRYSGKSHDEFAKIIEGHAQKDLDILIKKVGVNQQKLVSLFTVSHGENIIDLISSEAGKKKVDLMVMGAKGRTSTSAIFIGSKAERMIRVNTTIPLMIIRKKGAMAGILETLREKIG